MDLSISELIYKIPSGSLTETGHYRRKSRLEQIRSSKRLDLVFKISDR
jgi:hypothetical protein